MYEENINGLVRICTCWVHVDNKEEIAVFRIKSEYVAVSTNLSKWKAFSTNPFKELNRESPDFHASCAINENEIIGISRGMIVQYYIDANKWE